MKILIILILIYVCFTQWRRVESYTLIEVEYLFNRNTIKNTTSKKIKIILKSNNRYTNL
jgi:hypothetical protein